MTGAGSTSSDELTVVVAGNPPAVAEVEVCVDGFCAPEGDPDRGEGLPPVEVRTEDGERWTFTTDMSTPVSVVVRLVGADRVVLEEFEVTPEWVRVGGSEECGGPAEAVVEVALTP